MGLLIGKVCQVLTELFDLHMSIFLFSDNNWSKCQWIFTKLAVCIDIVEIWFGIAHGQEVIFTKLGMRIDIVQIWFGIANGQICQFLTELPAHHTIMARYYRFTFLLIGKMSLYLLDSLS